VDLGPREKQALFRIQLRVRKRVGTSKMRTH